MYSGDKLVCRDQRRGISDQIRRRASNIQSLTIQTHSRRSLGFGLVERWLTSLTVAGTRAYVYNPLPTGVPLPVSLETP